MGTDITFILSGVAFGLSAGLSPGPLLTLVIAETLRHGIGSGIKVAVAPLLTDVPIVCVTVGLLWSLADVKPVLGIISLFGAAFLAYLGTGSLLFSGVELEGTAEKPKSIRKGVIANFLNPSPYLFWFSIGGPMTIKAMGAGLPAAVGFVAGFYVLLVGAKIMLAVIVGKSRRFLKSGHYVYTLRCLGLLLFVFAAIFLWDGLVFLGIANGPGNGY